MKTGKAKNVPASVRARLLALSKERGEDFTLTLVRYAAERLLCRLAKSRHADSFILKGALLLALQTNRPYRPTRDVDFLVLGDASAASLRQALTDIAQTPTDEDGLVFDVNSLAINEIREGQEYGGWRASMRVLLERAQIPLQIDVAFGDAIVPGAIDVEYPTLLDTMRPRILAYPLETIVAEKIEAMVTLGMTNSRMKDFYDLFIIAETFDLDGVVLAEACRATFARRGTALPTTPPSALSNAFIVGKEKAWTAFLRATDLADVPRQMDEVMAQINAFTWPLLHAANAGAARGRWAPGRGWST